MHEGHTDTPQPLVCTLCACTADARRYQSDSTHTHTQAPYAESAEALADSELGPLGLVRQAGGDVTVVTSRPVWQLFAAGQMSDVNICTTEW